MTPEQRANMVICAADADQIWHASMKDGANDKANPTLPDSGPITTNSQPAQFGVPDKGSGIGFLNSANFEYLGHLRGDDVFLFKTDPVYYGVVLRAKGNTVSPIAKGDILIAVKGTEGMQEWINDAMALFLVPDNLAPDVSFSEGFIKVYNTMFFVDPNGRKQPDLIRALQPLIANNPNSKIYISGHSLGAALATYLTYDLYSNNIKPVPNAGTRIFSFFFASPKTGDARWTAKFQNTVQNYQLVNYAADMVPDLPPTGIALANQGPSQYVQILPPNSPGALGRADDRSLAGLAKNHSPTGYAHMIDINKQDAVYDIATQILHYQIDVGQAHP